MKKILNIFIIILVIVNSVLIYNRINNIKVLNKLLGFGILNITSGSMYPEIEIGEIVVIHEKRDYEIGDIITYTLNNKYLITHRIVQKKDNEFLTKGDYNNTEDEGYVKINDIQGKVIFHSKILGKIYKYKYYILSIIIFFYFVFNLCNTKLKITKESGCNK